MGTFYLQQVVYWCIASRAISNLSHWLITLSTPLSQLTSALSLATTPRHVLYALPTPVCCRFLVSTQRLLPVVSASLLPQFGTHSLLTFALVLHHILSVVFLKPTALSRPSVSPSGSHKCLRFGLWSTLCTIKDFIYLLTYLLLTHKLKQGLLTERMRFL